MKNLGGVLFHLKNKLEIMLITIRYSIDYVYNIVYNNLTFVKKLEKGIMYAKRI